MNQQERDEAREFHSLSTGKIYREAYCSGCLQTYPCDTIRVLDAWEEDISEMAEWLVEEHEYPLGSMNGKPVPLAFRAPLVDAWIWHDLQTGEEVPGLVTREDYEAALAREGNWEL